MKKFTKEDLVGICKQLDEKFELTVEPAEHGVVVSAEAPTVARRWAKAVGPDAHDIVDDELVENATLEVLAAAMLGLKEVRDVS